MGNNNGKENEGQKQTEPPKTILLAPKISDNSEADKVISDPELTNEIRFEFMRSQIQSRYATGLIKHEDGLFSHIPRDVLLLIFSQLDTNSALNTRCVSRSCEYLMAQCPLTLNGTKDAPLDSDLLKKLLVLFPKTKAIDLNYCRDVFPVLVNFQDSIAINKSKPTSRYFALQWMEEAKAWKYIIFATDHWYVSLDAIPLAEKAIRAGALYELGRFEEALPLWEEVVQDDPTDISAQNNLGMTLHRLGRHKEALTHLNQADFPFWESIETTNVKLATAASHIELGQYKEALILLGVGLNDGESPQLRQLFVRAAELLPESELGTAELQLFSAEIAMIKKGKKK